MLRIDGAAQQATLVDQAATATLPNGSTLSIVGYPELIEHYDAYTANLYAVLLRMCGDKDRVRNGIHEARTYFGQEKFTLNFGEQSATPRLTIGSLPAPRGGYFVDGECATGRLLMQPDPHPEHADDPALHQHQGRQRYLATAGPIRPCPRSANRAPRRPPRAFSSPNPPWVGCPEARTPVTANRHRCQPPREGRYRRSTARTGSPS